MAHSATDVSSYINANRELVKSIPINSSVVSEIDAYIKETEDYLRQELVNIPAKFVIRSWQDGMSHCIPKCSFINQSRFDDISWDIVDRNIEGTTEELRWEDRGKGFGFYHVRQDCVYDSGFEDHYESGPRICATLRHSEELITKLTGASVEMKLRMFPHFAKVLSEINSIAVNISDCLEDTLEKNFTEELPF